nr:hypothetical protein [Saccharibacillus endophyticus]
MRMTVAAVIVIAAATARTACMMISAGIMIARVMIVFMAVTKLMLT